MHTSHSYPLLHSSSHRFTPQPLYTPYSHPVRVTTLTLPPIHTQFCTLPIRAHIRTHHSQVNSTSNNFWEGCYHLHTPYSQVDPIHTLFRTFTDVIYRFTPYSHPIHTLFTPLATRYQLCLTTNCSSLPQLSSIFRTLLIYLKT